ncbi:MAG TPA: GGDEF domain-containing protein [Deltaproteobacteria bacterium]|nr:GGDEF domain-containing protein [Deltaproteobacteria bacterium]HOM30218.1 GGDEF domain-containing protein [Deltaproteobacteria bacterium]HPP81164.1 GGDEF domain-containing protein [Deltaproteobacteria bacterium]
MPRIGRVVVQNLWEAFVTNEADQSLRIKRFLMAFASYCMWCAIVWYFYTQGLSRLSFEGSMIMTAAALLTNAAFYAVLRSGLNKRLKDPSMTLAQMMFATLWIMVVAYIVKDARGIMLLLYLVVFIFGAFRLTLGEFLRLSVFASAGYALVVFSLHRYHPDEVNLKVELINLLVLSSVLFWFSFVGSYINKLRRRLNTANRELKDAMEIIRFRSAHDDLTGVYNRGHLFRILKREKGLADREGTTFCLCIFDIDDFKAVNDTFGHRAGDTVLETLACMLMDNIRLQDYLARYGGEEFVIVLAYPTIQGAAACAERLRRLVSNLSFEGLPEDFRVTVSMGLTRYISPESVDDLLKRADRALYEAKRSGKNALVTDPALRKTSAA